MYTAPRAVNAKTKKGQRKVKVESQVRFRKSAVSYLCWGELWLSCRETPRGLLEGSQTPGGWTGSPGRGRKSEISSFAPWQTQEKQTKDKTVNVSERDFFFFALWSVISGWWRLLTDSGPDRVQSINIHCWRSERSATQERTPLGSSTSTGWGSSGQWCEDCETLERKRKKKPTLENIEFVSFCAFVFLFFLQWMQLVS